MPVIHLIQNEITHPFEKQWLPDYHFVIYTTHDNSLILLRKAQRTRQYPDVKFDYF